MTSMCVCEVETKSIGSLESSKLLTSFVLGDNRCDGAVVGRDRAEVDIEAVGAEVDDLTFVIVRDRVNVRWDLIGDGEFDFGATLTRLRGCLLADGGFGGGVFFVPTRVDFDGGERTPLLTCW